MSYTFRLKPLIFTFIAIILISLALMMGAAIGETTIPFQTVYETIALKLFNAKVDISAIDAGIVWHYRLSRAVVGACCGASLALCGVVLQSILRNPLADPYLLGISAGASTGAVCVMIIGTGLGVISMSGGAFIGALVAFVCVALLAFRIGRSAAAVILAGIAGAQFFNALTAFIVTRGADAEQARGIMFWLMGNLSTVRWVDVAIAFPVTIIGFVICLFFARALDAFAFGTDSAASLGIPVRWVCGILITCCALMTAVMVSLVGAIGFVGLVIPHAARALVGTRHQTLIPVSAVIGAIFLIAADVVSRIIVPGQVLPIGVITALVGAPIFAFILVTKKEM
ncbi:iron ABC transporter permease [Bartonella sp. HY329]|uniref:FecCD family ABC transporter permease n=1 Tax=unclassified Bartonella TaxID=2645622 RepID=UPI0021C5CE3F|nr:MULTISPECIES: iron ABC transporter permease [unclassified Bartonella]UXM95740.1 iron ABC transporter permease [Bartonella sp. HY329]UXN10065.1 iron ABC transporter permease [Bartonella sp. HY328]